MERFRQRAEMLGHDIDALTAGEEVSSTVTVEDIDELRDLLHDGLSPQARSERGADMRQRLGSLIGPQAQGEGEGLDKRAEAYVYGDEPLSQPDRELLDQVFPLTLQATSLADKTLAAGEAWNLGTSTAPQVINLGTLTMEPGSSILAYNTVVNLSVETLVRNGGGSASGSVNYDIGIFGKTGSTGTPIAAAPSGAAGNGGSNGNCEVSGSEPGDSGGPGAGGGTGITGGAGNAGGNGSPSLSSSIEIGAGGITGSSPALTVMTRSGTGGRGGTGGQGGTGGAGGNGGDGASCACTGTKGGDGGKGGTGGRGGTGGHGGDGTTGGNVYVTVPAGAVKQVTRVMETAPPGEAGPGGMGGTGGAGGGAGGGGKHEPGGNGGGGGAPAAQGPPGASGTKSGAPGSIYVNGSA
jgi:hypothetical protein